MQNSSKQKQPYAANSSSIRLRSSKTILLVTVLAALATGAAPAASLPTLTATDVGAPGLPGSMKTTTDASGGSVYTIIGGGNDIWNNADNFHYAYFKVTGNFDYVVKVQDLQGPDNWSKAELMAREDDGSGAPQGGDRHISQMTTRAGGQNQVAFQWRGTRDGGSAWPPDVGMAYPIVRPTYPNTWLRLRREGSVFINYLSSDGATWQELNRVDTANTARFGGGAFNQILLLGLAVTAHNDGDPDGATAVFSNFGPHIAVPVAIASQPAAAVSVSANQPLLLTVGATGDPIQYQWRKDGKDLTGATQATYKIDLAQLTDAGTYSVRVFGDSNEVVSANSVVTVTPDVTPPTILSALGTPSLTEVVLSFSERLNQAAAESSANYTITTASGSVGVTAAVLSSDATKVTLTTAKQTLGTKHTVNVKNVADAATVPNPVAAGSKAVFFPVGKITQDANGFLVFEAENFDRNLDDNWLKDTTRGNPSGGVSMVNPNGKGGSESATKLEYDVEFKSTGTHHVWYRASGDSGSDDSGWFHLDGDRPPERVDGNQASMTGFSGQADFVWRSQPQDGGGQYTIEVATAGQHVVALARREDGSYFDKFIITTDLSYTPTGFGPPETRAGAPGLPTVSVSSPTEGQQFPAGANITLTASASGASSLEIARVEFTANGNKVGETTASPFNFTWNNAQDGVYKIRATATDEIGGTTTSPAVQITVGTPPPQALLVVGNASVPVLNPSDAGIKARLESQGWQVSVANAPTSQTSDADGKQLIITSSTVSSGDVGNKFQNSPVAVLNWEQALQDNFFMTLDTGTDRGSTADQTKINIVKADHPLAGGLSAGVKTVTTAPQPYSWGLPNANAIIIATIENDPTQALIYGYDKGAKLIDDTTPAPARRVMFFTGDDGFAAFTEDGLKLFDAAVAWASMVTPKPTAPTLSLARTATGLTITFTGTLQSADSVNGQWTDVSNAASPLAVTPAGSQKFYRAKR